jgi:YhcH/YjgK/YiaL family protein
MILDQLAQWRRYAAISPRFVTAFNFLEKNPASLPAGRNEIDGDDVYALLVRGPTTPLEGRELEVHRDYIDIQCVLSGREVMYWAPLSSLGKPTMSYDAKKDAALFPYIPSALPIRVSAGQFTIFFPDDGHIPSCAWDQPSEVVKAVIKVRIG